MATGQRQQQQQQRQNDVVYPVMSASGPTRLDASTLKTAIGGQPNGNMMHRTHTVEIVHVGSGHGNTPPVARKGETSKVLCV
jgi:hypothetical protein